MTKTNVKKIIDFSEFINTFIKKLTNKYIERKRKCDLLDTFIYRLLYSQIGKSSESTVSKLNKLRLDNHRQTISRQAYESRDKSINSSFYQKVDDILTIYLNTHFYNNQDKNEVIVYAVDGTSICLLIDKKNKNKTNINGDSSTCLISGVYNVTYQTPVALDLVDHKNERRAIIDFFKNRQINENSIYIFDKGYIDQSFFDYMIKHNIKFVCRLRDNMNIVSSEFVDKTVTYCNNQIRVIKYTINDKNYYLGTNLFDNKKYTVLTLKQLYHDRWSIEEYFKYVKKHFNLSYIDEFGMESIKKTIYSQLIISKIINAFTYIFSKDKNKFNKENMILNKSLLTDGFFTNHDLLYKLIMNKGVNRVFIEKFVKISVFPTHTRKNESYERIGKRPYHKWYIKKHFKKYVKTKNLTEDEINKAKIDSKPKMKTTKQRIELKQKNKHQKLQKHKKQKSIKDKKTQNNFLQIIS